LRPRFDATDPVVARGCASFIERSIVLARRLTSGKYQTPMETKNYTLGQHLVAFLDVLARFGA